MNVTKFFSPAEQEEIKHAIVRAESYTSGEIRVHLENYCLGNPFKRALKVFNRLKMNQTEQRNGVLFYVAVKSRKLAIVGDEGIHQHVKQSFWDEQRSEILQMFADNHFKEGLIAGILATGEKLKKHFPHQDDDKNELSDDLSFGKI
jgi:uncharacterized membrane protein